MDTADTHHTANSFVLDPGGALYFQEGTFHHTQVETPWGPPRRCANAGVYRYEPRTRKFDVYVTYPLRQSARARLRSLGTGHRRRRHGRRSLSRTADLQPARFPAKAQSASAGLPAADASLPGDRDSHRAGTFPTSMQGNLLVANVIGFQGILQYRCSTRTRAWALREVEPIVYSSDETSARPTSRSVPTGRSTSPTGTTRSSATCSTTCGIPIAIAFMAASIASPTPGRPLETPAADRRRADRRRLLDLLKDPRRPRPLSGSDRIVGPRRRKK